MAVKITPAMQQLTRWVQDMNDLVARGNSAHELLRRRGVQANRNSYFGRIDLGFIATERGILIDEYAEDAPVYLSFEDAVEGQRGRGEAWFEEVRPIVERVERLVAAL